MIQKCNDNPNRITLTNTDPSFKEETVMSLHMFKQKRIKVREVREEQSNPANYYVPRTGKNLRKKKRSKNDP